MAVSPFALLLLPRAPSPLSLPAARAAYGPALSSILSSLSDQSRKLETISRIDIALSWSHHAGPNQPRASIFNEVQKMLAMIYRLICIISARDSIIIDGPAGIDARVFLVDLRDEIDHIKSFSHNLAGPIVDVSTLALSNRPWSQVFAIESEEGESLLQHFLKLYDSQPGIHPRPTIMRVIGGVDMVATNQPASSISSQETSSYHYSVAVGGTFDHLHAGHKLLLTATALAMDPTHGSDTSTQRTVTVGITGEELLTKKKYAEVMESWNERQEKVSDFLESIILFASPEIVNRTSRRVSNPGPNGTFVRVKLEQDLTINYVQISDPYGPTITDEAISALVISKETRSGGQAVNDRRTEKGWSTLEVFEVDVLDSTEMEDGNDDSREQDFQSKISSTEIRRQRMEGVRRDG
jgi:phosphopantetheine adenylyltransferase